MLSVFVKYLSYNKIKFNPLTFLAFVPIQTLIRFVELPWKAANIRLKSIFISKTHFLILRRKTFFFCLFFNRLFVIRKYQL